MEYSKTTIKTAKNDSVKIRQQGKQIVRGVTRHPDKQNSEFVLKECFS